MLNEEIYKLSEEIFDEIVEIRRKIHKNPEIAFNEHKTADLVTGFLDKQGIKYKKGIAKTGITGLIKGFEKEGTKTIGLRADMDALPILEKTHHGFRSEIEGVMHACGHDAHVACLIGAAYILNNLKDKWFGNVKLIFQPAEEGEGGAKPMIDEGVLDNPKLDACVAGHVWPNIPIGKIWVKSGPVMASPDNFKIVLHGKGGHGAMPYMTVNPITIGCEVISVIQSITARKINPSNPVVISICRFLSGEYNTVIPDTAIIEGTARTLDIELRKQIPIYIEEAVKGVVKAFGGSYEFEFEYLFPPTINDEEITAKFAASSSEILGSENIIWGTEASMGGEDFAYFAERVPSVFFRLGAGNKSKGIIHPLHSPLFDIDEECLKIGSRVLAQFAVDFLIK